MNNESNNQPKRGEEEIKRSGHIINSGNNHRISKRKEVRTSQEH